MKYWSLIIRNKEPGISRVPIMNTKSVTYLRLLLTVDKYIFYDECTYSWMCILCYSYVSSVYGWTHTHIDVKNFKWILWINSLSVQRLNVLLNCFLYLPKWENSLHLHIVLCSSHPMTISCNIIQCNRQLQITSSFKRLQSSQIHTQNLREQEL